MRFNEKQVLAKIKERIGVDGSLIRASMEDYRILDSNRGVVKMVFSFSTKPSSKAEALNVISKTVGESFKVIPKSMLFYNEGSLATCIATYSKEPEYKEWKPEEDKAYKLIQANTLVSDEDNSVWHIEEIGGKKFIVKDRSDELQAALSFRQKVVQASVPNNSFTVEVGDVLIACDVEANDVTVGIVTAKEGAVNELWTKDSKFIKVHDDAVIGKHSVHSYLEDKEVSRLKEYFDNLYKNSEFKQKFREILNML